MLRFPQEALPDVHGLCLGPEFADRIMLGEEPGLEVLGQFIGIAASSSGFDNVGGVLGWVLCNF